jgi:hypothetical protein
MAWWRLRYGRRDREGIGGERYVRGLEEAAGGTIGDWARVSGGGRVFYMNAVKTNGRSGLL